MVPKEKWPEADFRLTDEDKQFIIKKVIPLFDQWEYARARWGLRFAEDLIESFGVIRLDHLNEP
jgi:hypothetical protein